MYADWLEQFYADDKHLQYQKALEGGYSIPHMNTLIQKAGEKSLPCIIPSTRTGRWMIYALAENERSLDELRRILTAALGSADTSADIRTFYHSDDAGEKILLKRSPGGVLVLTFLPLPAGEKETVNKLRSARMARVYAMLQTVMDLYSRRPVLTSLSNRQTGRILRDFYTACHAQDGKTAEQYLEELRGNQALSPLNLLFLELLAMAASAQWEAILSHPRLEALLRGRVPERIQRLLLRSTGHFMMNAIQDAHFPADSREKARRLVLDLIPLFKSPPRFTHHASFLPDWQLWAIGAALLGAEGWQTATTLLQPTWIHQVEQWVTGKNILPLTVEVAEKALIQAPVVTVLSLDDATDLLIEALTADVERESEIFSQLVVMPEATRQEIEKRPKIWAIWLDLEKRCDLQEYGWNHWLADLQRATESEHFESLRQRATLYHMEWLPATFIEKQWQELLEQPSHSLSGMVLRDALPNLLTWLQEYDVQVSASLWPNWLMLFALEDVRSEEDVRLAGMILDKLLSSRFKPEEYTTALEAIEIVSKANISVRTLGYSLDISELLYDKVTGDDAARLGFWIVVQEMLNERWERLDVSMQFSARMVEKLYLGSHAGHAFPAQTNMPGVASPLQRDLKGKTLLIYSLMEGAARRGRDALCHLYPGLSVELNHDHVSTPALLNLVDKADYIIFATGSSKHQAFYAVTDRRRDIIYPSGKGASSMITAFKAALE